MLDVAAFILVGGASSRMGKDKSQLQFGGRTSVQILASALQSVARSVISVGARGQSREGLPNIPDLREKWGPLAGIQAALHQATTEYCLIVACDLPFVTSELCSRLLEFIKDSDAVAPLQSDGRIQPLCAIYRRLPCLRAAEEAISCDEHSPRALLDRVRTRYIDFAKVSDLKGSEYFFFNVNTPDNYERAKEILEGYR